MNVFFGFKDQKLVTVIYSLEKVDEDAIDCDYYISEPQDAEKQISDWKNKHKA